VLISHNAGAETAYAWSAYTMGMGAGLHVLAITRQGAGLADAIETVAKEQSHTYSVSYSAVLMVLARLAGAWEQHPAPRGSIADPGRRQ